MSDPLQIKRLLRRPQFLAAAKGVSEARGGIAKLAKTAELNVTTLYRTLSAKGNPELRSLTALLRAMGMRLAVAPLS